MDSLDLQAWLDLVSTAAIVIALVFAGVQVREANRTRRDQAAVAMIQSTQDDSWTRAMNAVAQLPADVAAEQVDAGGPRAAEPILDFGVRLESIGYMVFSRMVTLATVDDLLGGVVLMFWSRAKGWVARERERSDNPKLMEWCEWLADRVAERRATLGHQPAQDKHRGWR
jgi:cbb3-type cytochrome oxidase subunit 3